MSNTLLEICCGSAEDVVEAWRAGANRVELNANLFQGGLTPTLGTLQIARREAIIPIMTMIRPRAGGFCYTPLEYETATADARLMLENGADGIVFGFLHDDGTVDAARTRAFVTLASGKPTVFHRALDVTPDWRRALETLINLGVTRVLTSGQAPSAYYGMDTIAEMIRFAAGAIEILPGAGINQRNAKRVIAETGCTQIHLSRHRKVPDPSTANNRDIFFGGALYPPEDTYNLIDGDYVGALRSMIDHP